MNNLQASAVLFCTVNEAAKRSGVSKDFIYALCHTGRIEYIQTGKKYLIHYPHFILYLENEALKRLQA